MIQKKDKTVTRWSIGTFLACLIIGYSVYSLSESGYLGALINTHNQYGNFRLVTTSEDSVSLSELDGRWKVIYFGFTRCSIHQCGRVIQNLQRATDLLSEEDKKLVLPIMITLDPYHDTRYLLTDYINQFGKSILALTGSPITIKRAAEFYGVFNATLPQNSEAFIPVPAKNIVIIDPYGNSRTTIDANSTSDEIYQQLLYLMRPKEQANLSGVNKA